MSEAPQAAVAVLLDQEAKRSSAMIGSFREARAHSRGCAQYAVEALVLLRQCCYH